MSGPITTGPPKAAAQGPAKGLNLQLDIAANNLKASLHEHGVSPRLDSTDWSILENKASMIKDLTKIQRELETIARTENRRINMAQPVPSRPHSVGPASPTPSSPSIASMHFRRRSLIRDDDSCAEDDATFVDSDTDHSSNVSELRAPELLRSPPLTSISRPFSAPPAKPEAEASQPCPRVSDGLRQIRQGLATLVLATLSSEHGSKSILALGLISVFAVMAIVMAWNLAS